MARPGERPNPLAPFLDDGGLVVLDGGLATRLEAHGCDLNDPLWSARLLPAGGAPIRRIHDEYLAAGADCIVTASYQATIQGFRSRGFRREDAGRFILRAVDLAVAARDAFWAAPSNRAGRIRPLVAASVGPYGAYLADGGEYRGDYDVGPGELAAFHRDRWHLLAGSPADLFACETIPSRDEAGALLGLLDETPDRVAWISFSCRDGAHINDGTPLARVVAEVAGHPGVVALGVNCTSPAFVPSLLRHARGVTDKPLVAYPNAGETYDAGTKRWSGDGRADIPREAESWIREGARLVGGCCRTGPEDIAAIRAVGAGGG